MSENGTDTGTEEHAGLSTVNVMWPQEAEDGALLFTGETEAERLSVIEESSRSILL